MEVIVSLQRSSGYESQITHKTILLPVQMKLNCSTIPTNYFDERNLPGQDLINCSGLEIIPGRKKDCTHSYYYYYYYYFDIFIQCTYMYNSV